MIKIFGERNTGTNALKKVIEKNSASVCLPGTSREIDAGIADKMRYWRRFERKTGLARFARWRLERQIDAVFRNIDPPRSWKHAATNFEDVRAFGGHGIIITARHPASWMLSLYKNPYHIHGPRPASFAEFLNSRWKTVGRERLDGRTYSPATLYETKLRNYIAFCERLDRAGIAYRLLQFENFVVDQEAAFRGIADILDAPAEQFELLVESTKSSSKDASYYKDYYENERWRDELGRDYDKVRGAISPEVLGFFGYGF